jgi:hypothetical protein
LKRELTRLKPRPIFADLSFEKYREVSNVVSRGSLPPAGPRPTTRRRWRLGIRMKAHMAKEAAEA